MESTCMHAFQHCRKRVNFGIKMNWKIYHFIFLSSSFSKLDLCEGGSFSPTIFNSGIEPSVFPFRVLYPFVRLPLCRRQHLLKLCTLFCPVNIKKRLFLTSCVFCFRECQQSPLFSFFFLSSVNVQSLFRLPWLISETNAETASLGLARQQKHKRRPDDLLH